MRIYGIDFTSAPSHQIPMACAVCKLDGTELMVEEIRRWDTFEGFEYLLTTSGPWIMGIDFPFGQSRRFIENIGWPNNWRKYVECAESLTRNDFRELLKAYRRDRPARDKEHLRRVDAWAGSVSPQKIERPPVGLMFFEGAKRIARSGATIPPFNDGDRNRIIVEAYPAVRASALIARRKYKDGDTAEQKHDRRAARRNIIAKLIHIKVPLSIQDAILENCNGDEIDALLCAEQARWAWSMRTCNYGIPTNVDLLEGWIVDESLYEPTL